MAKLTPGEEYFGQLHATEYSFMLFKIEPPIQSNTLISFSTCLGRPFFQIFNKTNSDELDMEKRVPFELSKRSGKDIGLVKNLQGQYYIMVEAL